MGRLNWEIGASPLDDARLDPATRRSLLLLFAAVGLVLLRRADTEPELLAR
ncbi:MAG TPA: hypothetical protein VGQ44_18190 [Gemmatimonadaceae bacterium]|jgi:hypothetical protein|nr:hypothetical protein [Gemmatimonadaceae bacterium]